MNTPATTTNKHENVSKRAHSAVHKRKESRINSPNGKINSPKNRVEQPLGKNPISLQDLLVEACEN